MKILTSSWSLIIARFVVCCSLIEGNHHNPKPMTRINEHGLLIVSAHVVARTTPDANHDLNIWIDGDRATSQWIVTVEELSNNQASDSFYKIYLQQQLDIEWIFLREQLESRGSSSCTFVIPLDPVSEASHNSASESVSNPYSSRSLIVSLWQQQNGLDTRVLHTRRLATLPRTTYSTSTGKPRLDPSTNVVLFANISSVISLDHSMQKSNTHDSMSKEFISFRFTNDQAWVLLWWCLSILSIYAFVRNHRNHAKQQQQHQLQNDILQQQMGSTTFPHPSIFSDNHRCEEFRRLDMNQLRNSHPRLVPWRDQNEVVRVESFHEVESTATSNRYHMNPHEYSRDSYDDNNVIESHGFVDVETFMDSSCHDRKRNAFEDSRIDQDDQSFITTNNTIHGQQSSETVDILNEEEQESSVYATPQSNDLGESKKISPLTVLKTDSAQSEGDPKYRSSNLSSDVNQDKHKEESLESCVAQVKLVDTAKRIPATTQTASPVVTRCSLDDKTIQDSSHREVDMVGKDDLATKKLRTEVLEAGTDQSTKDSCPLQDTMQQMGEDDLAIVENEGKDVQSVSTEFNVQTKNIDKSPASLPTSQDKPLLAQKTPPSLHQSMDEIVGDDSSKDCEKVSNLSNRDVVNSSTKELEDYDANYKSMGLKAKENDTEILHQAKEDAKDRLASTSETPESDTTIFTVEDTQKKDNLEVEVNPHEGSETIEKTQEQSHMAEKKDGLEESFQKMPTQESHVLSLPQQQNHWRGDEILTQFSQFAESSFATSAAGAVKRIPLSAETNCNPLNSSIQEGKDISTQEESYKGSMGGEKYLIQQQQPNPTADNTPISTSSLQQTQQSTEISPSKDDDNLSFPGTNQCQVSRKRSWAAAKNALTQVSNTSVKKKQKTKSQSSKTGSTLKHPTADSLRDKTLGAFQESDNCSPASNETTNLDVDDGRRGRDRGINTSLSSRSRRLAERNSRRQRATNNSFELDKYGKRQGAFLKRKKRQSDSGKMESKCQEKSLSNEGGSSPDKNFDLDSVEVVQVTKPLVSRRLRPFKGSSIVPDWVPSNGLQSASQQFLEEMEDTIVESSSVPKETPIPRIIDLPLQMSKNKIANRKRIDSRKSLG